jgi:D-threo-aldose 1-dehydrogenase
MPNAFTWRVNMRSRLIHGTSVEVTELGFGGASLGNLFSVTSDSDAAASVAEAWDRGIRYFDTAPSYGLGLSERRLGTALAAYPRSEFTLSTKVGRSVVENENPTEFDDLFVVPGNLAREWDFSRDGILRSIEASLTRLGTDYIDILYLHDPDEGPEEDGAAVGAKTLIELRDEGVVRAVGIGTNSADAAAQLFRESAIDLAMLAGRYTLIEQDRADAVFEAAGERSIVAVGVFNTGLLSTERPGPGARYNYVEASDEMIALANRYADIAEAHHATLPQAAIAFPLLNPQVASIAIGMRKAAQVASNAAMIASPPDAAMWDDLAAAGMLRATRPA